MENKKIVIVIPTYNEKENIGALIDKLLCLDKGLEIIVVDDNSPDGTWQVVEDLSKKNPQIQLLVRKNKRGLGSAYEEGFKKAIEKGADLIFGMDADLSHDPKYIPDMLKAVEECDVVIGSRHIKGAKVVNWPISRVVLSIIANRYIKFVTGIPVKDNTNAFICYRPEVLKSLPMGSFESSGYSFIVEIKYRIFKNGFRIKEIPIVFVDRSKGKSKISHKELFTSLVMVWKLRFGLYKK